MLKVIKKGFGLGYIIGRHFFHGVFARAFFSDPREQREFLVELLSKSCRDALRVLKIEVTISDQRQSRDSSRAALLASNHLSYVDVMVISAWRSASFVTSVEVQETPFLGKVATDGGCLFVERRSTHGVRRDLRVIADHLKYGISVAVFPEATSTDGSDVKPFKRGLLSAAQLSGVEILPICINYTHVNGKPIDSTSRDSVFYYGTMSFLPHIVKLMKASGVKAELKILNPIPAETYRQDLEPTALAYEQICSAFVPVG